MTSVREYIVSLFNGQSIPEAMLLDTGLDLEQEYSKDLEIGPQIVELCAGIINMVSLKAVSENGFSMQWDTDRLGRFYMWLCKKYGISPDPDVMAMVGVSAIIDISDIW